MNSTTELFHLEDKRTRLLCPSIHHSLDAWGESRDDKSPKFRETVHPTASVLSKEGHRWKFLARALATAGSKGGLDRTPSAYSDQARTGIFYYLLAVWFYVWNHGEQAGRCVATGLSCIEY